MGCDIHTYVEYLDPATNKWVDCETWEEDERDDRPWPDYKKQVIRDRDYRLFGLLSNVRCDAPSPGPLATPVAEDKREAFPCSPNVRRELDAWASDAHSHGIFTLEQFLLYDWNAEASYGEGEWKKEGPLYGIFADDIAEVIARLGQVAREHNITDLAHVRVVLFYDN